MKCQIKLQKEASEYKALLKSKYIMLYGAQALHTMEFSISLVLLHCAVQ
jgi:hypothetical protein